MPSVSVLVVYDMLELGRRGRCCDDLRFWRSTVTIICMFMYFSIYAGVGEHKIIHVCARVRMNTRTYPHPHHAHIYACSQT